MIILAMPLAASAEERLDFNDIDFNSLSEIQVPMVSAPVADEAKLPDFRAPLRKTEASDYYFNEYILKAVEYLRKNYGLKGYNIRAALTHNIAYGKHGTIKALKPPQTMCVAAALETMLTAYQIYTKETGDNTPYDYLPKSSYEGLGSADLRGHVWVNHDFNAWGTADALRNFGMGVKVKFEDLKPGAFVNINRTTKTGHAVVFLNYITANGKEQSFYNNNVIGFKYFSSQGGATAGKGGFDYRYAIFSKFGCPTLSTNIKRDCNVIYSEDQRFLNTGMMLSPKYWTGIKPTKNRPGITVLDEKYFDGKTTDDDL